MKTSYIISFVLVISLSFQSCRKGGPWGIKGKGKTVTEVKDLRDFDQINLSIDADILYTQDSVYKVEVSAQENILAVLDVKVEHHTLKFEYRRNVWEHNDVKVIVHSPDIKDLKISGSGDITAQNDIKTDKMEMSISGSGDISLPGLDANSLKASISGSGDLKLSGGAVKSETFTISGSGNVDAEELVAADASLKISGPGEVTLHVTENLEVSISGSGDVRYKGKPVIDSDISGSGRLIHIE